MNPASRPEQILSVIQADHDILSRAIKDFRKLFAGELSPDTVHQFPALRHLLAHRIAELFADEESRLFPVLLATETGSEIAPILAELRQNHIRLQAEAQHLAARLDRDRFPQLTADLGAALLDFFTQFEKHVVREDQVFNSFA